MNKIFSENYVAAISILWVVLMACLVILKRFTLDELGLNEIGDALAGAFAPLGFFWLVAGFYQQGKGLEQNSHALNLQAQELSKSTAALHLQAKELKATANEQKRLTEIHIQEQLSKRYSSMPNVIFDFEDLNMHQEPYDVENEQGHFVKTIDRAYVDFYLTITNKGETARQLTITHHGGTLIRSIIEMGKNHKDKIYVQLTDAEVESLISTRKWEKKYKLLYTDVHGNQYSKEAMLGIYEDTENHEFYINISSVHDKNR